VIENLRCKMILGCILSQLSQCGPVQHVSAAPATLLALPAGHLCLCYCCQGLYKQWLVLLLLLLLPPPPPFAAWWAVAPQSGLGVCNG